MKIHYDTDIGRCKCGYEGYMIKYEDIDSDNDVRIFEYYCPKCGKYIGFL